MKILVCGGNGMLGHKLVQILSKRNDLWATLRKDAGQYVRPEIFYRCKIIENLDVENIASVRKVIDDVQPDVLINAVGIIKQLPTAKNVIKTLTINSVFPHQLAEIAGNTGARLITISTDCVFSGKKGKYIESDISDAEDLYGKSKYLGEVAGENCLTLRTSIIGRELESAHSLLEWFLSQEGKTVRGFRKAVYSGFPTIVLAEIIENLIEKFPRLQGLYHVSSEPINKYELLKSIKEFYKVNIEIEPFDDFEIDRSLDSEKFREATGFIPMNWREMVEKMAADNSIYKN